MPFSEEVIDQMNEEHERLERRRRKLKDRLYLSGNEMLHWPTPNWLVPGYLVQGSVALLHGNPGSGKSFLALDWGLHVTYGKPWQGLPVMQGCVLYVTGEGLGGFSKRLKAWISQHAPGDMSGLSEIAFTTRALSFESEKTVNSAVMELEKDRAASREPIVLIIIDTLARCMGGLNENSSTDMSIFVSNVARFSRALDDCAVLILHHSRKTTKDSPEPVERGSSALKGAVDSQLQLDRKKGEKNKRVLVCQKQKDFEEPEDRTFHLKKIRMAENLSSCVILADAGEPPEVSERQYEVLSVLSEGVVVTLDEWRERTPDVPPKTFEKVTPILLKRGLVVRPGHGIYSITEQGLSCISASRK